MSAAKAAHPLLQPLRGALAAADLVRVREILEPLPAEERAALRREAMPEVTSGLKASVERLQNAWQIPPSGSLTINDAFTARLAHPNAALRAYRLASVGLGLKKDVDTALFSTRLTNFTWGDWSLEPQLTLPYQAGLLLLSRDEPWRDDTLYRLLDGEEGPGMASEGAFELALRLLQDGRGPRDQVLAAAARQARRLAFRLWAQDGRVFPWGTDLGRAVLWAALEARDEPLLASIDNASMGGRLVQRLVEMTAAGQLDRASLIALALRRLAESSRPFEANWWGRLLEALELSEVEWGEQSEGVLDLIGAPNPRAVSEGLSAAGKLLRRRLIEPAQLVPVLSLAVTTPTAGSAKAAVALLRRCADEDDIVRLDALTTALTALQHPKPAVHDAVVQWLEADSWWKDDPEAHYAVADACVGAPSAAAVRLDALMPADPSAARETTSEPVEPDHGTLRADLDARISAAETPRRKAWLETLKAALDGGRLPQWSPPLDQRWSLGEPLTLPTSVEETAQILLRVTVSRLTPQDWERIAFGVRLPMTEDERQMLPRLLDPVLRLRAAFDEENPAARLADWGSAYSAAQVAEAWSGGTAARPAEDSFWSSPHLTQGRLAQLRSILGAIRRGDRQPPLGTPTHESGWLGPHVFTERLLARTDLPEDELWELSAALYRLAPDAEARAAAWARLAPVHSRWGQLPGLMLAAALAPGEDGERGQVDLVNWLRRQRQEKVKLIRDQAQEAMDHVRRMLGMKKEKPVEEKTVNYQSLRMVTAALRCRHGMDRLWALELVNDRLPAIYRRLMDHRDASIKPKGLPPAPEPFGVIASVNAGNWTALADLLPEIAGECPMTFGLNPEHAFLFPPVGLNIALAVVSQPHFHTWGIMPSMAVVMLREPFRPVAPFTAALLDCLTINSEVPGIVGLWSEAITDGRLRLTELADALAAALADKERKPRAILGGLELLVRQCPAARDAVLATGERVLAGGMEGITPNDRVRLLELLIQWHSEAGSGAGPEARTVLEKLAAKGKGSRGGTLARQLLDLPVRTARRPDEACRAHDVAVMLAGMPA